MNNSHISAGQFFQNLPQTSPQSFSVLHILLKPYLLPNLFIPLLLFYSAKARLGTLFAPTAQPYAKARDGLDLCYSDCQIPMKPSTLSQRRFPHTVLARILFLYARTSIVSPALKAYLVAYLYVTLPKLLAHVTKLFKTGDLATVGPRIKRTLCNALGIKKFPALAGLLVLQINVLEPLCGVLLRQVAPTLPLASRLAASTLLLAFAASLLTFPRFQDHALGSGRHTLLDLSLLVATRAADTLASAFLGRWGHLARWLALGDGALFMALSLLIMYSWFFHPERLPPAYRNWITSAADMDVEMVHALKYLKEKKGAYGVQNEYTAMLADYCVRHGRLPTEGCIVANQPLSCECVHAFKSKSCEVHALWRFWRGFKFALKLYGGLNALMLALPRGGRFQHRLWRAMVSLVRSLCFLASFIALCWYGVCLGRTRLLPKMFPAVPLTVWDDKWCVVLGLLLCGLSCFVETAKRRKELALFVVPRAVGTVVSFEPSPANLRAESVAFALSMAVLVAFAKKDPALVRGLFGKGLVSVFSLKRYE